MDDSRYVVRLSGIGSLPTMEITQERKDAVVGAYHNLVAMVETEDKWDLVVENFREYESQLVSTSVDQLTIRDKRIPRFFEVGRFHARRLVNLLSAAKLYVDHLKKVVPKAGTVSVPSLVGRIDAAYRDDHDYQLVMELRNHLQHAGLPISGSMGSSRVGTPDLVQFLFYYTVRLDVKRFLQDESVCRTLRNRLSESGEAYVDLNRSIRRFVEILSNLHDAYREHLQPVLDSSVEALRDLIDEYAKEYPMLATAWQKVVSIHDWPVDNQLPVKTWEVSDVPIQNLGYLRDKNVHLTNLSKMSVTSAPADIISQIQDAFD